MRFRLGLQRKQRTNPLIARKTVRTRRPLISPYSSNNDSRPYLSAPSTHAARRNDAGSSSTGAGFATTQGPAGTLSFDALADKPPAGQVSVWETICNDLTGHDQATFADWNNVIDTLLVFAGLFSAVVTAFLVEVYRRLQQDSGDVSNAALLHIITQLSQLSDAIRTLRDPSFSSPIPSQQFTVPRFSPAPTAVMINCCWFASLVCSLIAASLGILVKQWIQKFMAANYAGTRQRLRVRELRYSGLRRWLIPEIIAFLPVLLRLALTLFLVGLIVFLWTLNVVLMWVVTPLVIIWLSAYFLSNVFPSFFSGCPYKSPEAAIFYILTRFVSEGLLPVLRRLQYISWQEREVEAMEDDRWDIRALATADLIFSDDILAGPIRTCVQTLEPSAVLEFVWTSLVQRLQVPITPSIGVIDNVKYRPRQTSHRGIVALCHILMDLFDREVAPLIDSVPDAWAQTFTPVPVMDDIFVHLRMIMHNTDFGHPGKYLDVLERVFDIFESLLTSPNSRYQVYTIVVELLDSNSSIISALKVIPPRIVKSLPELLKLAGRLNGIKMTHNRIKTCTNLLCIIRAVNDEPSRVAALAEVRGIVFAIMKSFSTLVDPDEVKRCIKQAESIESHFPGSAHDLLDLLQPRRPNTASHSDSRFGRDRIAAKLAKTLRPLKRTRHAEQHVV